MTTVWQVLIVMLPALLQGLRGNSANPAALDYLSLPQNTDQMIKDESTLTRLHDPGIAWHQDAIRNGNEESIVNVHPNSYNFPHTIKGNRQVNTNRQSQALVMMKMLGFSSSRKNHRTFSERTFSTNSTEENWGSHPIGTKETFVNTAAHGGAKWSAYFYDQAVAAVLQTENGTMLRCTVQENIEEWEQKEALLYLGEMMPLKPIPFNAMVHLITICGTLNMPPPLPNSRPAELGHLWWLGLSTLQGILPGTLWCGMQDRATYYYQLGSRQKLDACCRAHDHCPIKLSSLTTRYGVTNLGIKTLSHCTCDLEFFRCLKAAKSRTANIVGQLYFNYLKMNCLDTPSAKDQRFRSLPASSRTLEYHRRPSRYSPRESRGIVDSRSEDARLECVLVDREGGCRKWLLQPKDFTLELAINQLSLTF